MPRSTRIDHRVQLGLGMEVRATDRVFILYMMCLFILADSESASLVRASENNTIQHNIYIYIYRTMKDVKTARLCRFAGMV